MEREKCLYVIHINWIEMTEGIRNRDFMESIDRMKIKVWIRFKYRLNKRRASPYVESICLMKYRLDGTDWIEV